MGVLEYGDNGIVKSIADFLYRDATVYLERKYIKVYGGKPSNHFAGAKHTKATKLKMSQISKARAAQPGWQPPIVRNGINEEWRRKMSEAKLGKHNGRISKEQILEAAVECKNQRQAAYNIKT